MTQALREESPSFPFPLVIVGLDPTNQKVAIKGGR